jgi:hypothetical protein
MLKGKVIGFSLLILFGGTAAVALLGYPYYSYSYREITYINPYTFVVTNEEPEWNETSDRYYTTQIGITELETNGTPVNVFIVDSNDEIALFLFNVTKISNVTLTSYVSDESTISVQRMDGDVEVALTVIIIVNFPPPPTAIVYAWPAALFCYFIAIIGFLMLISIEGTTRWVVLRGRRQTILIAFLVLLSIILTAPYITGTLDRSFVPVEQTEIVSSGSQRFILDAGNPSHYLEIVKEIEAANYSIHVGPLIGSQMTYRMVIQDTYGSSYLEATFVNSTNWQIEGATTIGANHTLWLARTDADVELDLSYSVTQTVSKPDVDPTLSTIQAFLGGAVLVLALLLSSTIEPKKKPEQT